jgi:hypothetical protein
MSSSGPKSGAARRPFAGGVSLAVSAPADGLYTATELNETAWEAARDWIEGGRSAMLLRRRRGSCAPNTAMRSVRV